MNPASGSVPANFAPPARVPVPATSTPLSLPISTPIAAAATPPPSITSHQPLAPTSATVPAQPAGVMHPLHPQVVQQPLQPPSHLFVPANVGTPVASEPQQHQQPSPAHPVASSRQSERMLLANASHMAQNYYNSGNFLLARRLLDQIALSYRHEGWKSVLTTLLLTAMDCAKRLEDRQGVVNYSIELLGGGMLLTPAQKQLVMAQLQALLYAGPIPSVPLPDGTMPQAQLPLPEIVFEVDRKFGILNATSHFLTVAPSSSSSSTSSLSSAAAAASTTTISTSSLKDVSVCVGDEFDLILSISAGFPVSTSFQRMDVYFYVPSHATLGGSSSATPAGSAGSSPAIAPYHLVLLPGGPSTQAQGVESGLAGAMSSHVNDRDLPVLRPDARGHVNVDLNFPLVQQAAAPTPKAASHMQFSFGAPAVQAYKQQSHPQVAQKTFRIRMKATIPTTNPAAVASSPALAPVASPANNPSATAGTASSNVSNANMNSLFPTSLVAALTLPAPAGTANPQATKSYQFRADILPSKAEDKIEPVSVVESRNKVREEAEKKAKKKGRTLPDDSANALPALLRAPTLKILPVHARARLEFTYLNPALLGEYFPFLVKVISEGDVITDGEISFHAAPVGGSSSGPGNMSLSALTPSGSSDNLNAAAAATTTSGVDNGGVNVSLEPLSLSRSTSTFLNLESSGEGSAAASHPPASHAQAPVRFYYLQEPSQTPSGWSMAEPTFTEITAAAPLKLQTSALPANASTQVLVFLRSFIVATPLLNFTLSYTSPSGARSCITQSVSALNFRAPFKVRTKVFSDALSGLAPLSNPSSSAQSSSAAPSPSASPSPSGAAQQQQQQPQAPQRLIQSSRALLHVEIENTSGAPLRIDELSVELSSKFFRTDFDIAQSRKKAAGIASGNEKNRSHMKECISPAAHRSMKEAQRLLLVERLSKSSANGVVPANATDAFLSGIAPPNSEHRAAAALAAGFTSLPTVCLAPGDKYTHLFGFLPLLAGKTRFTPLLARWNRISPAFATPATASAAVGPVTTGKSKRDDEEEKEEKQQQPSSPATEVALPLPLFPTPSVLYRKDLLSFHILKAPLHVSVSHPPSVEIGQVFQLELRISNSTDQLHDVTLEVLDEQGNPTTAPGALSSAAAAVGHSAGHASMKLVFSGRTKGLIRVRPHDSVSVVYRVCPLECGSIALPRIQLKAAGLVSNVSSSSGGNNPQQSVLLMDPADVGVVFVHPKNRTAAM